MTYLDSLFKDSSDNFDSKLSGKPDITWVNKYIRTNDGEVVGHFRANPNGTTSDNLTSDIDGDGVQGYFEADVDGDGSYEALDVDGDSIADALETLF